MDKYEDKVLERVRKTLKELNSIDDKLTIVTNPKRIEHIGDGYHEEYIATTLGKKTILIEPDYKAIGVHKGDLMYIAKKIKRIEE